MQKMINKIQYYPWGSQSALTQYYGISNPDQRPMAEMWMGAHPEASSLIRNERGKIISLFDEIRSSPKYNLGEKSAQKFGELPFLFKVLCAAEPLSIQVHPDKKSAEEGFAREDDMGIPLDSPNRNYKDRNHKPELVYAITPFLALNGFRSIRDSMLLLKRLQGVDLVIDNFLENNEATSYLSKLFTYLLTMKKIQKNKILQKLNSIITSINQGEPWDTIRILKNYYPEDNGLLLPLILNVVKLLPGEAMFLEAKTPHSYLSGVCLEIMANSDNVLRAGLTKKHIDIPELLNNVKFTVKPVDKLLIKPMKKDNVTFFPVPVEDFDFSIYQLGQNEQSLSLQNATIIFCMDGSAILQNKIQKIRLKAGESCFFAANDPNFTIKGNGRIAKVSNLS